MRQHVFPKNINNEFHGSLIAILILALVTGVKFLMGINIGGLNPFVTTEHILTSVDGIQLNQFPPAASRNIVDMAQSWGLLMLILSIFSFLTLLRYRAMIPIIYIIYLLEHFGRKLIGIIKSPGAIIDFTSMAALINWGLITILIVGLILSIYKPFPNADKTKKNCGNYNG